MIARPEPQRAAASTSTPAMASSVEERVAQNPLPPPPPDLHSPLRAPADDAPPTPEPAAEPDATAPAAAIPPTEEEAADDGSAPIAAPAVAETVEQPATDEIEEASEQEADPGDWMNQRPRRNKAKAWTLMAFLYLLLVSAAGGALWYFGPPGWLVNLGLAPGRADVGLQITEINHSHRRVPGGQLIFTYTAVIVNKSGETLAVPPVFAEVRDERRKLIKSWSAKADKAELAPGETARISQTRFDIPPGGEGFDLRFVP